ncbi:DUF4245 domain-containing protein [Streptomyces sp. 4N509B]|uniref:DUF4245 domain-containing protein n=1 Tax=Streptomyces sp. 4N509B TaxID=3457413 RepID=UPI003FD68FC2
MASDTETRSETPAEGGPETGGADQTRATRDTREADTREADTRETPEAAGPVGPAEPGEGAAKPAEPAEPGEPGEPGGPREPAAASQPAARRPKLKTARDMLLSMAVISAGAFGFWLLVPHDESLDTAPLQVEYEVAATTAARVAPYELLVPEGLNDRWRATSVDYEPEGEHGATWRLGFVDPDDEYAALAQSDGEAGPFLSRITQEAEATDATQRVGGREWTRYEGSKYDALVLREGDATTVVFGTAPFSTLGELAAALRPAA